MFRHRPSLQAGSKNHHDKTVQSRTLYVIVKQPTRGSGGLCVSPWFLVLLETEPPPRMYYAMEHFESKKRGGCQCTLFVWWHCIHKTSPTIRKSYTWLGDVAPLEWRGSSFRNNVRVKKRPPRDRLRPRAISNPCLGSRGRHHRFHNVSIRAVTAEGSRHRSTMLKTNCDNWKALELEFSGEHTI